MTLTNETLRILLREYVGAEFSETEVERLRPLVERQLERLRELQGLDLGGDDPRTMHYINDRRLSS